MKRPSNSVVAVQETKKSKNELAGYTNNDKTLMETYGVSRTSGLFSPIMILDGHGGDIFTCEFHPDGDILMSSGFDRQICKFTFKRLGSRYTVNLILWFPVD